MKIYRYIPDSDTFDSLIFQDSNWQIREQFVYGKKIGDSWISPVVQDYAVGKKGEFPSLDRIMPILSDKALNTIRPLIENSVEILPLNYSNYWVINVLEIVDCLNLDHSSLTRNPVTKRVSSIQKYFFKEEMLKDKHIFKIPQTMGIEVLISNTLKDLIMDAQLDGLNFSEKIFQS